MGGLAGKHALITGGGTGIGAAIAMKLAGAGAAITIAGRRPGPLQELAGKIPGACWVAADITLEADAAAMIAAARSAHGPVDIAVANAGAAESTPLAHADLAHWQRMLNVNLTGSFLTVKAVLPDVTRVGSPGGRIIFIASTAGLKGYRYVAAYCAAKHGLVGFARALAAELASTGVTVNAVCPGFTDTPLLEASLANLAQKTSRTRSQAEADLKKLNPQGRFIRPDEVAATVLWLCTPAAQAITGQAISVSGGEV